MIKFNIATINCCTNIEGPFKRLAIWFQGCDIGCKGCCNADLQPIIKANIVSLDKLINIILNAKKKYNIEGVTYLGGEPTLQKDLPLLTAEIKKYDLGIIAFTGHIYANVKDELYGCDVVIDGKYDSKDVDQNRKIIGSINQNIVNLTNRYPNIEEWFLSQNQFMEININDKIVANGDAI